MHSLHSLHPLHQHLPFDLVVGVEELMFGIIEYFSFLFSPLLLIASACLFHPQEDVLPFKIAEGEGVQDQESADKKDEEQLLPKGH